MLLIIMNNHCLTHEKARIAIWFLLSLIYCPSHFSRPSGCHHQPSTVTHCLGGDQSLCVLSDTHAFLMTGMLETLSLLKALVVHVPETLSVGRIQVTFLSSSFSFWHDEFDYLQERYPPRRWCRPAVLFTSSVEHLDPRLGQNLLYHQDWSILLLEKKT